MDRLELVVVLAEAEYDGQVYSARLSCRAEDWNAEDWIREYYRNQVTEYVRQHVPAHVPVTIHTLNETLEGGTP